MFMLFQGLFAAALMAQPEAHGESCSTKDGFTLVVRN